MIMIANELLDQLDHLTDTEKLHIVGRLVKQVELSRLGFDVNQTYEVWSPEPQGNTIEVLTQLLEQAEQKRHEHQS
jgi:hypothetical protein